MSKFLFFAICFLLDFIFEAFFPSDPSMVNIIFVPSCLFIGMLCVCKEEDWLSSIYNALFVGLISDYASMNYFGQHALLFILCVLIMKVWSKHLSNSLFEQLILLLSTVFIKEFLVYLSLLASIGFKMSVMTWLLHRSVGTLFGNVPLAVLVLGLHEIKKDYDAHQERIKRREESLFWKKF